MQRTSVVALISNLCLAFVCLACLPVFAQENQVVRVGVAVLRSGPGTVSGTEARDRLVKALRQRKPDKKSPQVLETVALEASSEEKALAEAREKKCEFVLYTHLSDLTTTYKFSSDNGGQDLPIFNATVEYRLNRAINGSGFAMGSVKTEDPTSNTDAVWQALSQVASRASAEIRKGKGTGSPPAVAATAPTPVAPRAVQEMAIAPDYCAWLPSDIAHADALRGACEYAITLPAKMPNFVCARETARYRGNSRAPADLISASVRYEEGNESYSDVKVNGRPIAGEADQTPGLRSTGEFGGDLRALVNLENHPLFAYDRESKVGDHAAWVFAYQIAEQKNPLWRLHGADQVLAPPYSGELWLDQKDGTVLRFRSVAKDMPPTFPMKNVDLQIDYERIAFGDGTDFVLPIGSTLTTTYVHQESSRNVVQFRDCHKFRARGRLVLKSDVGTQGPASSAQVAPSQDSLQKESDEGEAIFGAIREQSLRENEERQEAEQKKMLDAVTSAALERISVLQREQQRIEAQGQAIAKSAAEASEGPARAILKVSAKLVLVSVVLRDAKGHAVGNLGQENFRLFDEGKPQVITHFSVEPGALTVPAQEKNAEKDSAPAHAEGLVKAVTNRSVSPVAERDTAYLFDDVHASFEDLVSARDAAERYLGLMKAGERAAVFTTSGSLAVDFTRNHESLLAGLSGLRPHPIIPESSCPPISYYMADLMVNQGDLEANAVAVEEAVECAFHGMGTGPERQQAQRLASAKAFEVLNAGNVENRKALAVLNSVIRRTSSMPGQRAIVLVSPGFLAVAPDMRQDVMEIVDRAVQAGIIVNTLDARGLYTVGLSGNSSHLGQDRLQFDSAEAQARSDVMFEFADGTGGIFFHSNNDLDEGFRRTAAAPEFVYVLGFSPQRLDGKFHKLKVALNGAGKFEVQARRGYYALKPVAVK
jgi:VWFA-related protein